MLIAALLSLAVTQPEEARVPTVDQGFCAGISWITLRHGETATVDDGPDFRVYRIQGPGASWWGVYSGNAASASDQRGPMLLKRDRVTVRRVRAEPGTGGYLAQDRNGWQNHFFGSVFHQTDGDRIFFDRVDFSPAGQAKCERTRH